MCMGSLRSECRCGSKGEVKYAGVCLLLRVNIKEGSGVSCVCNWISCV